MKYAKAIILIMTGLPVVALAQTPQAKPSQPAAAQQAQPTPSPNAKRLVSSDNFYRATPKPQPGSAVPVNPQPASIAPTYAPGMAMRPITLPVVPQAMQSPAMAPVSGVVHLPQPVQAKPAAFNPAAAVEHSSPAAVDYAYGKLTVVADNASLGAVLKLIATKTGAVVDLAPELQNEPVVARLGPDSVHEVLSRLFDSPHIDYIVFGTGDEPGSLQRILVRKRNTFGQMTALRPRQNAAQPAQQFDPDGNPIRQSNPAEAQMTQEQRNEAWQKAREEMIQAEIKQQAEDREREKTQPAEQPVAQDPPPQPQQQDNPPQQ